MKAVLELELINDPARMAWRDFESGKLRGEQAIRLIRFHKKPEEVWVKIDNVRIKPKLDFSRTNRTGTKGVFAIYTLDEGTVYTVCDNGIISTVYVKDWEIVKCQRKG
jgi:hypothetical protein